MQRDIRKRRRGGGRAARIAAREMAPSEGVAPVPGSVAGGQYRPLTEAEVERIHTAALHVLEHVGMGVIGAHPPGVRAILEAGGRLTDFGRVSFPRALVEDVIAKACRGWTLHAVDPDRSIEISTGSVHYGTAGGAVSIVDFKTGRYRETTLADLYDVSRLIDTLPNIHWCYRPLIARDMPDLRALDINTAYALAAGTSKPWGITVGAAENVAEVVALLEMVRGGPACFRDEPTAHMVQGAGVPPLRFAEERCLIKEQAIRHGFPIMLASAPQAGATAPAALAGTIVQVVAEALAGLIYANVLSPGHPICFAPWPFVCDLRTGAMSGGSAEQALLMAGVAQMARFYDIPCSVAAGMADAKLPDAQAGFEKAYTTAAAGLAGASMVHEAAGMHASLLGCAFESFVIDDDMLGNVLRLVRGIEVSDETLSLQVIAEVNRNGPGHYLGHAQTLSLMQSEYHYPPLSDRATPEEWEIGGAKTILDRARDYVRNILGTHFPDHISPQLDARIRDRFDIRLPRERMRPGPRRDEPPRSPR